MLVTTPLFSQSSELELKSRTPLDSSSKEESIPAASLQKNGLAKMILIIGWAINQGITGMPVLKFHTDGFHLLPGLARKA